MSSCSCRRRSASRSRPAQEYGELESVKAVSGHRQHRSSGEVIEVNEAVVDSPELVNEDPYGAGWLIRVRLAQPGDRGDLLDADAYRATLLSSRCARAGR